jgi:GNAT superfamily N-acetyltransferase
MARRFRPLTFARLAELSDTCATCRFWETERLAMVQHCGVIADEEAERAWYGTVSEEWGDPGRIVYQDRNAALGFVKYAPARYFPRTRALGPGPTSDDAVLLACLHIRPEARDIGLGTVLLQAALSDLTSRGERVVEAYGSVAPASEESPFITANFLLRHGFRVVRPHPDLPLLRLELAALAAWTESLEAALEALHIRLTPQRVPGSATQGH